MKKIKSFLSQKICSICVFFLEKIIHRKLPQSVIEWRYADLSWSQFAEDLLIERALDTLGKTDRAYYVDVGAFDPFMFSNTLKLRNRRWHGINIDAQSKHITRFRKYCPDYINLHSAVYSTQGTEKFYTYGFGTTGRLEKADTTTQKSVLGEEILSVEDVQVTTLSDIMHIYAPKDLPFGLLSIDCEGADFEILKSNDWLKYKPWIVAIEDQTWKENEVNELLYGYGYELFAVARLTKIFISRN